MAHPEEPSSGVKSLIDRVKSEAVDAGKEEAQRIIDDARRQAARILDDARSEAERHLAEAKARSKTEHEAVRAALEQAARDAILHLQESLTSSFGRQLARSVEERMQEPEFLERLILELLGPERVPADEAATVLLPPQALHIDDLRSENPELGRDPVDAFVLSLSQRGLRDGVEVRVSEEAQSGVRIRLGDGDLEVDASSEAVTELLGRHLLPRFRALLEGVFR